MMVLTFNCLQRSVYSDAAIRQGAMYYKPCEALDFYFNIAFTILSSCIKTSLIKSL